MKSEYELIELTVRPKFKPRDKVRIVNLSPDSDPSMKDYVGQTGTIQAFKDGYYYVNFDPNRSYRTYEFELGELEKA